MSFFLFHIPPSQYIKTSAQRHIFIIYLFFIYIIYLYIFIYIYYFINFLTLLSKNLTLLSKNLAKMSKNLTLGVKKFDTKSQKI